LGSVGIEADNDRLDKLIAALKDKDTNELIAQGTAKLASIPSGGVGSGAAAPAATAAVDVAGKVEETETKDADAAGEESDEDFVRNPRFKNDCLGLMRTCRVSASSTNTSEGLSTS